MGVAAGGGETVAVCDVAADAVGAAEAVTEGVFGAGIGASGTAAVAAAAGGDGGVVVGELTDAAGTFGDAVATGSTGTLISKVQDLVSMTASAA